MHTIETLLHHKLEQEGELRIVGIDAHDDDAAARGHIEPITAGQQSIKKHHVTLVGMSRGTKNFDPENTDIGSGGRAAEGRNGARVLGYQTFDRLNGTDGKLIHDVDGLAEKTAEWAWRYGANLILSMGFLEDHPGNDHIAAHQVAFGAARLLARRDDRSIGVLAVHPSEHPAGDWLAEATDENRYLLHSSLAESHSQFRYTHPDKADGSYVIVTPQHALHKDELDEISYYPIEQAATYTYHEVGSLAVARITKIK